MAFSTQFPTFRNETIPPDIEHTTALLASTELGSTVIVTGNETLELARGVYAAPLTRAVVGALDVKLRV